MCADKDGKQWAAANQDKVLMYSRRSRIRKQYGLELDEYDKIIARGCGICGTHEGTICLDHDHTQGKIRDALCSNCNRDLDLFGDDPERLKKAIDYLAVHQGGDADINPCCNQVV